MFPFFSDNESGELILDWFLSGYGLGPQLFFHYLPYKDLLGKIANNFAIDAYFLLLMSSFLTFKFIHFKHDHDQLLFLLSSVNVNTCQFIPVTAHVGSLLRVVPRFTCFPEIKRKQKKRKLLIFKNLHVDLSKESQ